MPRSNCRGRIGLPDGDRSCLHFRRSTWETKCSSVGPERLESHTTLYLKACLQKGANHLSSLSFYAYPGAQFREVGHPINFLLILLHIDASSIHRQRIAQNCALVTPPTNQPMPFLGLKHASSVSITLFSLFSTRRITTIPRSFLDYCTSICKSMQPNLSSTSQPSPTAYDLLLLNFPRISYASRPRNSRDIAAANLMQQHNPLPCHNGLPFVIPCS